MLKSFFLSERKLLNAILRVTLKYMKDVSFSWNEMLFAMQRQIFMFRAFLRAKNTNAVRAKNTNAVFSATKQMKRMQGQGCWKASFSVRESAKCNFKSNAQVHERCFFLMKWNVICNAEDRFSCLELFLRAKNTNAVRAKNTNAVFSATKQMKRMQGQDAEKLLSQWEKVLNAILRVKLKYMKCFFLMKWNVICNAEDRFYVLELFCRASHVRASMHRITSLELLRTLMMCLVQLSKWRECKAKDAEKLLSQWEKVAKCNFKSNAQVHERCFSLMKWNVICNAEDRFSCLELF